MKHIADASIDLIYLDPSFNSKRDHNQLFKTPKGHESDAQITAFDDEARIRVIARHAPELRVFVQ